MASARVKVPSDLVQQIFQLKWEEDEKERAAALEAEVQEQEQEQEEEEDGEGGNDHRNNANAPNPPGAKGGGGGKKFPIKDEAVAASAEVLRCFAAEIVSRAAEMAHQDGDDMVNPKRATRDPKPSTLIPSVPKPLNP
jgi:hypothetical protein